MKEGWFQIFVFFWKGIEQPSVNLEKGGFTDHSGSNNHQNHSVDQRNIERNKPKNQQKNSKRNPDGNWDFVDEVELSEKSHSGDIDEVNEPLVSGLERYLHQRKKKINPKNWLLSV